MQQGRGTGRQIERLIGTPNANCRHLIQPARTPPQPLLTSRNRLRHRCRIHRRTRSLSSTLTQPMATAWLRYLSASGGLISRNKWPRGCRPVDQTRCARMFAASRTVRETSGDGTGGGSNGSLRRILPRIRLPTPQPRPLTLRLRLRRHNIRRPAVLFRARTQPLLRHNTTRRSRHRPRIGLVNTPNPARHDPTRAPGKDTDHPTRSRRRTHTDCTTRR